MSYRLTLRIRKSEPDDLEVLRFLQMLDDRGLSRQGWIKRALVLGFQSLEADLLAEGLQKPQKKRAARKTQPTVRKPETGNPESENPVAEVHGEAPPASSPASWYPVDATPEPPVMASPERKAEPASLPTGPRPEPSSPVAPSSPPVALPPTPEKEWPPQQPVQQPTPPVVPVAPVPAALEPASTPPAAPVESTAPTSQPEASRRSVSSSSVVEDFLKSPAMQFSEETMRQARRLIGGFGKEDTEK